jgi:hypothetical protein
MKSLWIFYKKVILISFVLTCIIYPLSTCDKYNLKKESKPSTQKEQIIEMINIKIRYSSDPIEKEILKDLKYDIISRVKEVGTNG